MLGRDLSGKERRPESIIIVPVALGRPAIEDVPRRGSGKHFRGGHNEKKMQLLDESLRTHSRYV